MRLVKIIRVSSLLVALGVLIGCTAPKPDPAAMGLAARQAGMAAFYGANGAKIDFDAAFRAFLVGAEQKDPVALAHLGEICFKGLGAQEPDETLAGNYFAAAWEVLRDQDQSFDPAVKFVRGKLLFYGYGRPRNIKLAADFWQSAVKLNSFEAMTGLADFYQGSIPDSPLKLDPDTAMELLERAAASGQAAARFELSQILVRSQPERAKELLAQAAAADYLPALIKLAQNESDALKLHQTLVRSADLGNALVIADLPLSPEQAQAQWDLLFAGATRGNLAAIERLGANYEANHEPVKAIVCYYLHQKLLGNPNPANAPKLRELDRQTALVLPVTMIWSGVERAEYLAHLNTKTARFIAAEISQIENVRENYFNYLTDGGAADCFFANDWYNLYLAKIPMTMAGDIFKSYGKQVKNPTCAYYFTYALVAGLCGQGAAQLAGVELAQKCADLTAMNEKRFGTGNCLNLLQANALALQGDLDAAYEYLFVHNQNETGFEAKNNSVNFVNFWCAPLRQEPDKLAAALGVKPEQIAPYQAVKMQDFYQVNLDCDCSQVPVLLGSEPELSEPADIAGQK